MLAAVRSLAVAALSAAWESTSAAMKALSKAISVRPMETILVGRQGGVGVGELGAVGVDRRLEGDGIRFLGVADDRFIDEGIDLGHVPASGVERLGLVGRLHPRDQHT